VIRSYNRKNNHLHWIFAVKMFHKDHKFCVSSASMNIIFIEVVTQNLHTSNIVTLLTAHEIQINSNTTTYGTAECIHTEWCNMPLLILIYIQQDATLHSLFYMENCSTCFGWYHHPSSGEQTTVSTASGICHTVTAYATDSTLKPVPTLQL